MTPDETVRTATPTLRRAEVPWPGKCHQMLGVAADMEGLSVAGSASPMLDAALDYAERNVPIFPVWGVRDGRCGCGRVPCGTDNRNAGKHPVGHLAPHGFKDATTDASTIRRWWAATPDANIATPTNSAPVLDEDP